MEIVKNNTKTNDFYEIIKPILENDEFLKINKCIHHGTSRLRHSLRVAYITYRFYSKMEVDGSDVVRAALLHDFFSEDGEKYTLSRGFKMLFRHQSLALENSTKYFDLTNKQKNIIECHMLPCCFKLPKYKEVYLVSMIDKTVATYEFAFAFKNLVKNSFKKLKLRRA